MDGQAVKHRTPSLFQTLVHRQIRPFRACQLPYEGEWTSDGGKKGGGVLTVQCECYRAPPLSLSFAKKRQDRQMLAVADEEGYVCVFNTDGHLPSMADCYTETRNVHSKLWSAHTNAVFDICWTKDDTQVLTASGDQTIRLWDIENKKAVGLMLGHTGSVKSICVHPSQSDILLSGSRDGCVFFWDLRCPSALEAGYTQYSPVTRIRDAHKGVLNARRRKGYSRSVTSVVYLKDERLVATAGANDGVVKIWDTRKLKIPVAHTPSTRNAPIHAQGARMHGIAGLSQDPTGTRLIATSVDSKIYMYDVMALAKGELKTFTGHTMGSFYIKASFSPDGSHILGGSTDHNAYLWTVDRPEDPPVLLRGHSGEVTAVDWCPTEHCKVATCSDDYTVRVWKLRSPRFSKKLPPKPSSSPRRHSEVESVPPKYSFLDLTLEDSQHLLQGRLPQSGKELHEIPRTDRDVNVVRLVEDSQHPLSTSQIQLLRTKENTNMEDSPDSLRSRSPSAYETEGFRENETVGEVTSQSTAPWSHVEELPECSGTILHPKRTRVLFREGDGIHSELCDDNDELSSHDCPRKENLENTFGASYFETVRGLSDRQVSPPFKRTRVPLKELNNDGVGIIKAHCSMVPAAKQFAEYSTENATSCIESKQLVADKQSTPPFNRAKGLSSFSVVTGGEYQVAKTVSESPLGHSTESPSSVLSPPSSTQRRRKTIMDYFSLQPEST